MFLLLWLRVLSSALFNTLNILGWSNDILKIFKQPRLVSISWFLLHLRDLLHLSLKNQKSVISQVNSFGIQSFLDLSLRALMSLQIILGNARRIDSSSDPKLRAWDFNKFPVGLLNQFFEVNLNCSPGVASRCAGVVNKLVEFVQPHPAGIEAEDEQHAFDEIGLTWAIRSDDACEVAMEFADHLPSGVGFKVFEHHMIDHQSWFLFPSHIQMNASRDLFDRSRFNLDWLFLWC